MTASPVNSSKGVKDAAKKKKGKSKEESDSSSEEERWLEKIKDPKMMTARQRAMYDRENNAEKDFVPPEVLMSLPTGYKEKVMTAEALERAQEKSAKRKALADQKREKERQKTMERLLKKQESKLNKVSKTRNLRPGVPIITYKSNSDHCVVIFPADYDLKFGPETTKKKTAEDGEESTAPKLCAICDSPKRYNCSKTNIPLCSFQCYKENAKRMAV